MMALRWWTVGLLGVGILHGCAASGENSADARPDRPGDSAAQNPEDSGMVNEPDTSVATDVAVSDARMDAMLAMDAAEDDAELTPDLTPDGGAAGPEASVEIRIGGNARVTASALNLRTGAGTSNSIITSMPCGSTVNILGGPMSGWWNIRYMTQMGWASGTYLAAEGAFDPDTCMMGAPMPDAGTMPMPTDMAMEVAEIFRRARYGVGYSYYWGHGSWRTDGMTRGSCSGSCPGCTHTGQYGADCSGFVAKVWQIPSPSPLTTDLHPYGTIHFFNNQTRWRRVARTAMQPADALVYNNGSAGHIVLYESGADPWGQMWLYEARGCSYGIVHNLRSVGSQYIAIRREGL